MFMLFQSAQGWFWFSKAEHALGYGIINGQRGGSLNGFILISNPITKYQASELAEEFNRNA
jgi:hypothetical protein